MKAKQVLLFTGSHKYISNWVNSKAQFAYCYEILLERKKAKMNCQSSWWIRNSIYMTNNEFCLIQLHELLYNGMWYILIVSNIQTISLLSSFIIYIFYMKLYKNSIIISGITDLEVIETQVFKNKYIIIICKIL